MTDREGLVSLDAIRDAALRIRGTARVTPLVDAASSDTDLRGLLLKCENLQPAGAFKIRGAANMLARLSTDDRRRGVITYSSGNHGQAVALAAHLVGSRAVVVMPTTAPTIKIDGARRYGAEVIFEGTTTLERKARAEAECAARGLTMVPPFDHEWIIAGQGTAGLEILEQCPNAGSVYVQVGGGGLISGVAAAIKRLSPGVRVVGIEPEGAAKMKASLNAGRAVTLERTSSMADGLLAVRPGDLTFRHVRALVDEVLTVSERQILEAVRWVFREARLVVEPSGAVSVAGALARADRNPPSSSVVAVLSGGNVSADAFAKLLTET